jgi:endonuclease YncB( thermonuclease family)
MDSVNMLVSGIINKEGRRYARVSFVRGKDIAEGIVPDGIVDHAEGFSDDEIFKLERYMRENRGEIMEQARQVNPLKNWLGL